MAIRTGLFTRALGVWVTLAATAALSGVARELWLTPVLGEHRAHQVGTLVVCALFGTIIAAFVNVTRPSVRQAEAIGAAWVLAAIAFEFGFGHWVDGLSWSRLLQDYDVARGRLLLLLWLVVAAGPAAFAAWWSPSDLGLKATVTR